MKRFLPIWCATVSCLLQVSVLPAFALPEFRLILPPQSQVTLTDVAGSKTVSNTQNEFQSELSFSDSTVYLQDDVFGVRLVSANTFVYLRPQAKFAFNTTPELLQGSVWIKVLPSGEPLELNVGSVTVKSSEGEFLVYSSPDQSDIAVKVITGKADVIHSTNKQQVQLDSESMTRLEASGFLIAPLPIEPSLLTKWWEFEGFEEIGGGPVAIAGDDQHVAEKQRVVLDGSNSNFEDGALFDWTLVEGPVTELTFDTTDITRPTFIPPQDGVYTFELLVTNPEGLVSAPDSVRIFVGENYLSTVQVFEDVSEKNKHHLAISYLYKHGVIGGYYDAAKDKRFFYPDDAVTRSQVLKVFFLGSSVEVPPFDADYLNPFQDVDATQWYAEYVFFAKEKGIISGHPDGTYRPDEPVNVAAAIKIALAVNGINLSSYASATDSPFADVPGDAWFAPAMRFAKEKKLIEGDDANRVYPEKAMTRGEVAELMYQLIKANLVGETGKLIGYVVASDGESIVSGVSVEVHSAKRTEVPASSVDGDTKITYEPVSLLKTLATADDSSFQTFLPVGLYSLRAVGEGLNDEQFYPVDIINQNTSSVILEVKTEGL